MPPNSDQKGVVGYVRHGSKEHNVSRLSVSIGVNRPALASLAISRMFQLTKCEKSQHQEQGTQSCNAENGRQTFTFRFEREWNLNLELSR
jgi:hypothetical protein